METLPGLATYYAKAASLHEQPYVVIDVHVVDFFQSMQGHSIEMLVNEDVWTLTALQVSLDRFEKSITDNNVTKDTFNTHIATYYALVGICYGLLCAKYPLAQVLSILKSRVGPNVQHVSLSYFLFAWRNSSILGVESMIHTLIKNLVNDIRDGLRYTELSGKERKEVDDRFSILGLDECYRPLEQMVLKIHQDTHQRELETLRSKVLAAQHVNRHAMEALVKELNGMLAKR